MDLKIEDVAELLNVSETTIRRWLKSRKIPAYRLNHQYRFSRIEIENWMMKAKLNPSEKGISEEEKQIYPAKLEEKENTGSRKGMKQFSFYRSLNRGDVLLDLAASNKEDLIRKTTKTIAAKLNLDAEVLAELLLDREKLMPTALNHGIAVPHARDFLKVPFDLVTVVFPKKPISYGALDGKPVNVLFFLFATDDKIHLHLLAKIAHLSSQESALKFLKAKPDKAALLEFIRNWEANLSDS